MKIKTLLIAVVLVLGLAATASAATQWTVGASPEPLRVATGYTEKVGAISFNTVNNVGETVTGTITIDYHNQITVPASAINVRFTCGGVTPCPTIPDNTFVPAIEPNDSGLMTRVVLNVVPVPEIEYSFVVDGVRINVTGLLGAGAPYFDINVNANVIASENQITNGQANALVLQRIMPPFGTLTNQTLAHVSVINGTTLLSSTAVTLTAQENFKNAFWKIITGPTGDPTQNVVQNIIIRPTQTIPAGISITFPSTDATGTGHGKVPPYSPEVALSPMH